MEPTPFFFLEEALSYSFHDPKLMRQALTHKSYINETKEKNRKDNERLELLGDSVLDLIMCQDLLDRFPELPEGDLSKMKAKIVSEETLAEVARGLNLGAFLFLGKGEAQSEGKDKPSLLSDAMEALIAAIYLDGGLSIVRRVVLRFFDGPLSALGQGELVFDYKTALQEYSQKVFASLPTYEMIQESGPDHEKQFEVGVFIDATLHGIGIGKTKKAAEQQAAQKAFLELEL